MLLDRSNAWRKKRYSFLSTFAVPWILVSEGEPLWVRAEGIVMGRNIFYLEAPARTQDLLDIKWTLRAAGYAIGSTWHEGEAASSALVFQNHWNASRMEELRICDSLVVICGTRGEIPLLLAVVAGFALARGLQVIWIGSPAQILSDFRTVQHFRTVEEFAIDVYNRQTAAA